MQKQKKLFASIGMIACALLVIVGILCTFGVFGGSVSTTHGNKYDYSYSGAYSDDYKIYADKTGYTIFGGDAYTYMSNNAAKAADAAASAARAAAATYEAADAAANAAARAANNMVGVNSLISFVGGVLMIGFGIFGTCHFGIIRSDFIETVKEDEVPAEVSSEEVEAEQSDIL